MKERVNLAANQNCCAVFNFADHLFEPSQPIMIIVGRFPGW